MSRLAFAALVLGALLLVPGSSRAQAVAAQPAVGTLSGTIRSAAGSPVAGAQVMVRPAAGVARGTLSADDGTFRVESLAAGRYVVQVRALGYRVAERRDVAIEAGGTTALALVLDDSTATLGAVRVVGQKRRTSTVTKSPVPLEDLPMAVQIVGEELMLQQQAIDLRDVVRNVSGVTVTGTYNGGYVTYNGRGFWMNNWSNFRRNGMMVWNMGHHFADNIEQVEVLKGPASIQYGDVAPGGIMNFVTKQPLATARRRVELKVGEYGLFRPTLDATGPIGGDTTRLYRVNATYERSQSFRDVVENETYMLAPTFAWRPSARLAWTLEATLKRDERVGDPGLISPDGTFQGLARIPVSRFYGEPDATYTFDDQGLYSTLAYSLRPALRLQHVAYATNTERTPYNIYFAGTSAEDDGTIARTQYYFNQWFRGGGTSLDLIGEALTGAVRHRFVVGADWMYNASRFTNGIDQPIATNIDVDRPRYGQSPLVSDTSAWSDSRFFYERTGLYAQDQLSVLDDRVQLLLGARFNVTRTGNDYDDPADVPAGSRVEADRVVSPRAGLVLKPRRWLSLYGSYAESYEMNGQDWIDARINVQPTTARQAEAGIKASVLDDRLGLSLTAFRLDKRDVYSWIDAETRPTIPFIAWDSAGAWATYQGGHHRSEGLELDANGRVADQLTVNAALSLIDATVVDDPAYRTGNQLEGNARRVGSLWVNWVKPRGTLRGLELGWGVFHRGRFFQTTANDADTRVDAFTSMDAALGYTFGRVGTRLNVSNLTNEIGYLSANRVYEPMWVRRAVLSVSTTF